jgi:protein AroM
VARTLTKRRRIGVVTPISGQIESARKKWTADGFDVEVVAGSPDDDEETRHAAKRLANTDLELIVLDCMGHHSGHQREVAEISGRPVIVAQNVVARIAGEYMSGVPGAVSARAAAQ